MTGLEPGMRVVVRYRIPPERPAALSLTDALGDLLAHDGGQVTVRTKHGDVVIAEPDIVAAKQVPPAPPARPARRPNPPASDPPVFRPTRFRPTRFR